MQMFLLIVGGYLSVGAIIGAIDAATATEERIKSYYEVGQDLYPDIYPLPWHKLNEDQLARFHFGIRLGLFFTSITLWLPELIRMLNEGKE